MKAQHIATLFKLFSANLVAQKKIKIQQISVGNDFWKHSHMCFENFEGTLCDSAPVKPHPSLAPSMDCFYSLLPEHSPFRMSYCSVITTYCINMLLSF